MSLFYVTLAAIQPPEGPPPRPAPTLDQLRAEHDRLTGECNDLRRRIEGGIAFVHEYRPSRAIARRTAEGVRRNMLLLTDAIDEREAVQRRIDDLEARLFGWRNAPETCP